MGHNRGCNTSISSWDTFRPRYFVLYLPLQPSRLLPTHPPGSLLVLSPSSPPEHFQGYHYTHIRLHSTPLHPLVWN